MPGSRNAKQTSIAVGTTSVALAPANTARNVLMLQNVGTSNVYIKFDGSTADNTGLVLVPNAAPLTLDTFCPGTAITAISATGTNNVVVIEQ